MAFEFTQLPMGQKMKKKLLPMLRSRYFSKLPAIPRIDNLSVVAILLNLLNGNSSKIIEKKLFFPVLVFLVLTAFCCSISPCQQFIPFAIIGSDRESTVGGKRVLGRQTKWGFVEVENKKHCEFAHLRDMLIK